MLSFAGRTRIFVASEPVDLRRGFDGLAAATRQLILEEPLLCGGREYVAAGQEHASRRLAAWQFA